MYAPRETEVFSPRLLTVPCHFSWLCEAYIQAKFRVSYISYTCIFHRYNLGVGGHSGLETPVPISNTEDKQAHVLHCTEVRESLGTADRCQTPLKTTTT